MDLFSEVRVDFKGPQELAANMKRSAMETKVLQAMSRMVSREMLETSRNVDKMVKGSERFRGHMREASRFKLAGSSPIGGALDRAGKDRDAYGGFNAAATGAASLALFYKAVSLANPTAMNRFTDAIEDATAVIGHRLVPYLNQMTEAVRAAGDWMARNPAAAKGIGLGIAGLAGAGLIGLGFAGAKAAVGGFKWAGAQAVGALSWMREPGRTFAGRADPHSYVRSAEQSAINQSRGGTTLIAPPGRGEAGRPVARRGGLRAGAVAGGGRAVGGILVAGLIAEGGREAYHGLVPDDPEESKLGRWQEGLFRTAAGKPGGMLLDWTRKQLDIKPDWQKTAEERQREKEGGSWGAAARPARYQDALGAIMSMRQEIGSGAGRDPLERTAVATEKIASKIDEKGGADQGGGWIDNLFNMMMNPQAYQNSKRGT